MIPNSISHILLEDWPNERNINHNEQVNTIKSNFKASASNYDSEKLQRLQSKMNYKVDRPLRANSFGWTVDLKKTF